MLVFKLSVQKICYRLIPNRMIKDELMGKSFTRNDGKIIQFASRVRWCNHYLLTRVKPWHWFSYSKYVNKFNTAIKSFLSYRSILDYSFIQKYCELLLNTIHIKIDTSYPYVFEQHSIDGSSALWYPKMVKNKDAPYRNPKYMLPPLHLQWWWFLCCARWLTKKNAKFFKCKLLISYNLFVINLYALFRFEIWPIVCL